MDVILDSAALTSWASRAPHQSLIDHLELAARTNGTTVVPTVVLVESLTGHAGSDASANLRIKRSRQIPCDEQAARRAAVLRHRTEGPSAADAVVAAAVTPSTVVVTSDLADLTALLAPVGLADRIVAI